MSTIDKDSKNCAVFVCSGLIVDFLDSGITPTVAQIRNCFSMNRYGTNERLTDSEITHIISLTKKYYNH